MNAFEIMLAILLPAIGASGAWVSWKLARNWAAELDAPRHERRALRLSARLDEELPANARLSAEIERLR